MARDRDRTLAELCAEQHGVFTVEQCARIGFDPRSRARRVTAGRWERCYPGVFRVAGAPHGVEARLLAACFAGGSRALRIGPVGGDALGPPGRIA